MQIDLANVPIGTKMRIRDGRIIVLEKVENGGDYPYQIAYLPGSSKGSRCRNGQTFKRLQSETDVIEILYEKSRYPTNRNVAHAFKSS